MVLKNFSLAGLRQNYALIPLVAMLGAALTGVVAFSLRTALRTPDVSYRKQQNPEPWNEYRDKEYRLYNPKNIPKDHCPAPKFD
ncbi:cytochrome c oxidase subunit NDUFA4-like [Pollicipes pollicipes]|uniref:cytochrome c oxidase subunit NDUFA4-like n=1 Tax=Pollicipes pollicipes TaxID=41117 RepID=UPI001884AE28|nr:cytochrome c oxidase subunit NDUFA4-like [Pollicipes pollicipes]